MQGSTDESSSSGEPSEWWSSLSCVWVIMMGMVMVSVASGDAVLVIMVAADFLQRKVCGVLT